MGGRSPAGRPPSEGFFRTFVKFVRVWGERMSYLELAQQALARYLTAQNTPQGPPIAAPPDEFDELTKKPTPFRDVTGLLRYAFRRTFTLVVDEADGKAVDQSEARGLSQQIIRLTDEAGPAWADAVFADELRRFRTETGRCGVCGGPGHAPEGS